MSENIYSALQATSEDIGRARRAFNRDKCGSRRDSLLCAMSYGIQMCLRAQSMKWSASGMSAGTAETQSGSGRKPASPTAAPSGGDAPTPPERESGD